MARGTEAIGEANIRDSTTGTESFERITRTVFVLSLVVGTLGIVVGTILDSVWVMTLVPVAAMLGYFAIEWYRDPQTLDNPLFADSLYYLGFLLTLVALTVSLYLMGEEPDIESVVHRFGVALVTTVLGLTLRILLSGFALSTEDSIQEAEAAVEIAVRRLRERLDQFSTDLLTQQSAFNEAMRHAIEQAGSDLAGMVTSSSGKIEAAADELAETASTGATKLTSTLDVKLAEAIEAICVRTNDLEQALATVASGVASAELPSDLFTRALEEPISQLANVIAEISDRLDADVPDLQPLGEELRTVLRHLSQDLREIGSEDIESLRDNIQSVGADLAAVSADLRSQLAGLSQAVTGGGDGSGGFVALSEALQRANRQLGSLQVKQKEYTTTLAGQVAVLEAIRRSSNENLDLTAEHRKKVAKNLEESTEAVERVFRDLTASVRLLRESSEDRS